ncbi:MAG TPA: alpha/beta hydrolase [Cyclobacteriaceae bacterium]|nr:alpha/beta hydrolase [Cyclobacteriaceae bacterium]
MKHLRFFKSSVFTLCLLFIISPTLSAQSAKDIRIEKEIVYGHAAGVDLRLDIAWPVEGKGPFPVILFFHGGGWQAGNKTDMNHWIQSYAKSGYAAATVEYRFAPAFKWPSQVQDAKAAVRYLRANAGILNIDPERIGVMGESAGGYLALMVGLTGPADSLEGDGGNPDFSSRVQAVVSYFSASDYTLPRAELSPEVQAEVMKYYNKSLKEVMADYIGSTNPDKATLLRMSVLPYIDEKDPPVLIFQGDADPFVSVEQAKRLEASLDKVNVRHELVLVKGGGHGWTGKLKERTDRKMAAFFKREIGGRR